MKNLVDAIYIAAGDTADLWSESFDVERSSVEEIYRSLEMGHYTSQTV